MSDCLFCSIASGAIPCKPILEDEHVLAFDDINPQAPVHALVIPRRHVASLTELGPEHAELVSRTLLAATRVARLRGLDEGGYRLVMNCGDDGCQSVPHLHIHVLGGRRLGWPPG
jgi:histidine triad (HIT) family protein